jgi:hypothetical protein
MSRHQARTKDEKFLIALYELAIAQRDLETPFDRYMVGTKIGLHPRGTDTICTLLLQATFVKKGEEKDVYLTSNGLRLIESLLKEK